MGMYSHPYAPLLLMLTQLKADNEMLEALEIEVENAADLVTNLRDALEQCCDCSFRD